MQGLQGQSPSQAFTILDRIGIAVVGFTMLALAVFPIAGRHFAILFDDFGGELPLLTRLATTTWFPLVLLVPVITTFALGLRRKQALSTRRSWIVGAFLLGGASLALCLVGMYLPVFSLASALGPE